MQSAGIAGEILNQVGSNSPLPPFLGDDKMVDEKLSALLILEELKTRLNKIEKLAQKMHENSCKIIDLINEYLK